MAASLGAALLAVLTGFLALLIGAATGSRAIAIGVSTAFFAAGYLAVGLSGLVTAIEPLRYVSPFYYANGTSPIEHGVPLGHFGLLGVVCVVLLAATVAVFERRNLVR